MKNYRVKKVEEDEYLTKYYPQIKILGLFWMNMFEHPGYYWSFEEAQKAICDYLRGPVIEYLSVDCGEN